MKLIELSIENFRSIKTIKDFKVSSFQALLGENNCGKSNFLGALEVFLSAGAGGVRSEDFNDKFRRIIIKSKFNITSAHLKKVWQPYLIKNVLILEKQIWIERDIKTEKESIKNEFHGYQAEPTDWFLSIKKIKAKKGERPKWIEIIKEAALPDYFLDNGNCNADHYKKSLAKYLAENDVNYEVPDLSTTQALGLQSNVVASLPKFYLLKAITDYSEEIDKRSTNTTFRRLMGDLSDRILKKDANYSKIERALQTIEELLNEKKKEEGIEVQDRLPSIGMIEGKIKSLLAQLMPTVENVKLKVVTEDIKSIFSRGVELTIDDGIETDVLLKGHGLQRCIVFSLLQTLILNERNELLNDDPNKIEQSPIILAIEEPELYIHPQIGKLFYDVLLEFSKTQQVIYSTHSPRFIDVYEYENIALIQKDKFLGTKILNCNTSAFAGLEDRKVFQGLTQLNSDVNELFFAKNVLVVEGPEDKIAVTETLKKLNKIKIRSEEIKLTIVVANSANNIPFFVRVLNAFDINYAVLHDTDLRPGLNQNQVDVFTKRNNKISDVVKPGKLSIFPIKLENTVNQISHFSDQYFAMIFFSNHENITTELEEVVHDVLNKVFKDKIDGSSAIKLIESINLN